jgi:hypothetical protein
MTEPTAARGFEVPASVDHVRRQAAMVGVIGLVALVAGAFVNRPQFFQSYLVAFIFWSGVSLGCLALLMVHHLSGGAWGLVIRRILEAAAKTLPLVALLFVPLIFGVEHVYEWAQPELVAKDPILLHKAPFLNTPFWVARTLIYFVLWSGMAFLLTRWSSQQDQGGATGLDRRFARLSGPGLVVYGLTVSLAAIDWMMSVDPHWFSTIYGFVMVGGQGLSALAFIIIALFTLTKSEPMSSVVSSKHLHDLGKLLFAFVMLYAYFTFSQFLIVWSANLPEEIPWYIRRLSNGWQFVMFALVLLHFALPFAMLLSADIKQNMGLLMPVALLLFVMRAVDVMFQVTPQFHAGIYIGWIDVAALTGVGGVWVAAFCHYLRGRPMLPVNDPYLREALANHGSH